MRPCPALAPTLLALAVAAPIAAGAGQKLPPSNAHIRFEQGDHVRVPFVIRGQHVWVRGRVGDSDSLWIVIDTGASGTVIDDSVAIRVGLRVTKVQESRGAGGAQAGAFVTSAPIEFGGLSLRRDRLQATSLHSLNAAGGTPMDVVVGYELFHDCVVRFDYPAGVMDVWDRDHAPADLGGAEVPMTLVEHHPYVDGELRVAGRDPIRGRFVIDTGSSLGLIIAPEAVERESLAAALPRTLEVAGRGIGGEVRYHVGRVDGFTLGALTFDHPIAALASPGPGRTSVLGSVGNIGGQLLARCRVTFDYAGGMVRFEPGPAFSDPFEADMSGMSLVRDGPDVVVHLVNPATPAAEAGLREGDRLTSIDAVPAPAIDLAALRRTFTTPGREVKLEWTREGEHLAATMVLRRII